MNIEQYLMTPEGMTEQVLRLQDIFESKRIFHLGDDDHLSVLFLMHLNASPVVAEYDPRIRDSLTKNYEETSVERAAVFSYDARHPLPSDIAADAFYINPPYSSKNQGKGAKVWISRASRVVPVGSTSVLVYPIDEELPWTLECLHNILEYAYTCGLVVTRIDRDIHTYEHLPKDPGLLSSNIYLYKYADLVPAEVQGIEGDALYR